MSHHYDHNLKLNRAVVHLSVLYERVQAFGKSEPYRIETQLDSDTGEVVIYGEVLREPPTQEWGVIIGDIVHNLRSALDQLVWQLTIANGHVPPNVIPPRGQPGGQWRDIRFPIYTFDPRATDTSGTRVPWEVNPPPSLWGIGPSLCADFERLQPFMHGQDAPTRPLAILDELWNTDKHRHLHLTTVLSGLRDIISPGTPDIEFLRAKVESTGPLKGRTELGRIRRTDGGPVPEMYVNPNLFAYVAFEEGPPAYGALLTQLLPGLVEVVAEIIRKFESHLP